MKSFSLFGLLALITACAARMSGGSSDALAAPCVGNDTVYIRADTALGLQLPRNRHTPRVALRKTGKAGAVVLIDQAGRVTIDTIMVTGELGPSDAREIRAIVSQWTFYPALLRGCAVRFRGPAIFSARMVQAP